MCLDRKYCILRDSLNIEYMNHSHLLYTEPYKEYMKWNCIIHIVDDNTCKNRMLYLFDNIQSCKFGNLIHYIFGIMNDSQNS